MRQNPLQFSKAKSSTKRESKPFVPGPNPELPQFIKKHTKHYYSPADKYDVQAFEADLSVLRAVTIIDGELIEIVEG